MGCAPSVVVHNVSPERLGMVEKVGDSVRHEQSFRSPLPESEIPKFLVHQGSELSVRVRTNGLAAEISLQQDNCADVS